jgi:hypothetical protein
VEETPIEPEENKVVQLTDEGQEIPQLLEQSEYEDDSETRQQGII